MVVSGNATNETYLAEFRAIFLCGPSDLATIVYPYPHVAAYEGIGSIDDAMNCSLKLRIADDERAI